MANNCKLELNGFLGNDPKVINKGDKTFVALRIATTDSYPVTDEKTGEITWKNKESLWHDVLVFNPQAVSIAKSLTKGDLVTILGTLSYKTIKDEKGFNINQASIVGGFVKKVNAGTSDEPTADEVAKAAEVVSAA